MDMKQDVTMLFSPEVISYDAIAMMRMASSSWI